MTLIHSLIVHMCISKYTQTQNTCAASVQGSVLNFCSSMILRPIVYINIQVELLLCQFLYHLNFVRRDYLAC